MTPVYDMKSGYRVAPGKPFLLPPGGLLIIEGIHALNPEFLKSVPSGRIFKVYISPLSSLQLDEANAVKTTDHRLLRRMSRDYLFRGHSASRTLSMWSNVRRGEHRWIFPHQDEVDAVVNSAMEYELRVLKPLVEPLLASVEPSDAQFGKAREPPALPWWPVTDGLQTSRARAAAAMSLVTVQRATCSWQHATRATCESQARELLALLALVSPASTTRVPSTSVLREFIGDGAFDCH